MSQTWIIAPSASDGGPGGLGDAAGSAVMQPVPLVVVTMICFVLAE